MDVVMFANTDGKGHWTEEKRETQIDKIKIESVYSGDDGKVIVYIKVKVNARTWNTGRHGLIYTDDKWLREFKRGMKELGLPSRLANSIDYTEQGMQGRLHVSLQFDAKATDVEFLEEFFGQRVRVEEF